MVTKNRRTGTDAVFSPGELLQEELEARGITQKDLAQMMGRPPQAISEICRGKKSITADTALDLDQALGIPAYLWMRRNPITAWRLPGPRGDGGRPSPGRLPISEIQGHPPTGIDCHGTVIQYLSAEQRQIARRIT